MTRRINAWCLGLVVLAIGCEGSPVEPVTQSIDAQLRPLLAGEPEAGFMLDPHAETARKVKEASRPARPSPASRRRSARR